MSGNRRDKMGVRLFLAALVLLAAPVQRATSGGLEDRFEIMELMDRYGVVHDFGTPEEYADLFTDDGEISIGNAPALIKGRPALIAQARRDHERFGVPGAGGNSSIMRHVITNRVVRLTSNAEAQGSSYVITLINDKIAGPQILSFSRYEDRYRKVKGTWRIAHCSITIDSGNSELGKKLGFR